MGSRGKAPGGGQGAKPPEADDILLLTDLILMLKCRPTQKKRRNRPKYHILPVHTARYMNSFITYGLAKYL